MTKRRKPGRKQDHGHAHHDRPHAGVGPDEARKLMVQRVEEMSDEELLIYSKMLLIGEGMLTGDADMVVRRYHLSTFLADFDCGSSWAMADLVVVGEDQFGTTQGMHLSIFEEDAETLANALLAWKTDRSTHLSWLQQEPAAPCKDAT